MISSVLRESKVMKTHSCYDLGSVPGSGETESPDTKCKDLSKGGFPTGLGFHSPTLLVSLWITNCKN